MHQTSRCMSGSLRNLKPISQIHFLQVILPPISSRSILSKSLKIEIISTSHEEENFSRKKNLPETEPIWILSVLSSRSSLLSIQNLDLRYTLAIPLDIHGHCPIFSRDSIRSLDEPRKRRRTEKRSPKEKRSQKFLLPSRTRYLPKILISQSN